MQHRVKNIIDIMIVTMYITFSVLAIIFTIYAGYCLLYFESITALTSLAAGVTSFGLSVFIAKAFEV